jgi:aminoglycoside phosphotransferase (APT) family kinase protein
MLPDTTGVFLTHGDLHLGNILVTKPSGGQITLTGVVDWGQAGRCPEYWEYCKAMIVGPYGDEWRDAGFVNIPLPAHETELQAFWEYWHWRLP